MVESQQGGDVLTSLPVYYIVPPGHGQHLPQGAQYIELDIEYPCAQQLFPLPYPAKIIPLAASMMEEEERNEFLIVANQAIMTYQGSQQTYGEFGHHWIWNALTNKDAFLNSTPVNQIRKNPEKDFALICGNGTSFHQQINDIPDNAEVFACWRVVKPMMEAGKRIDYACHLDHMDVEGWATELPCPAIGRPEANPAFIKMAEHGLYGYFEPGKSTSEWFASHHGITPHEPLVCTIASMMLNAAIYAGYRDIVLLGIDHAWLPEDDYDGMNQFSKLITNSHGIQLRTERGFELGRAGFTAQIYKHPDLRIWQASKIAIDIPEVNYKALSECQTHFSR